MSNSNNEKEHSMSNQQIEEHDEPIVMKAKSFRCDDETWDNAMRVAIERGDNLSEILRATLRRYTKRHSS